MTFQKRLQVISVALLLACYTTTPYAAAIVSGPMVGATAQRQIKLWLQGDSAATVIVEYWPKPKPKETFKTSAIPLSAETDFTAHITLDDLEPGQQYDYRITLNGKKTAQTYTFKTQTLWHWRSEAPDWKLAFGSCAYLNEAAYDRPGKPYGGPPEATRIFDSIAQKKPDMMLWGGDNLYYRESDFDSEFGMRYRWRVTRQTPALQTLLQTGTHYAIWDDHDYGSNDANASFPFKHLSLELFKRYWANPSYGLPETPGIFSRFQYNDVEFFLLDNRYYRDSDKLQAVDKTKLGAAQLRWLKNALLSSTAPVKIILAGSQMTNSANTKAEGWDKFPAERADILKFLTDHNISGVLLLTGDRHFTELLKTERPGTYPLYELTCSPLTSAIPGSLDKEKANPQVVPGTFTAQRNFCTLDFSGPQKNRKIAIKSYSSEGQPLWEKEIAVSDLQGSAP